MGKTSIEIPEYIKKMLEEEEGVQPSQFQGRIIFMSMYDDIISWQNQNDSVCRDNAKRVAEIAENVEQGRWSFLGRGDGEGGAGA